jgi:hypothetical protein
VSQSLNGGRTNYQGAIESNTLQYSTLYSVDDGWIYGTSCHPPSTLRHPRSRFPAPVFSLSLRSDKNRFILGRFHFMKCSGKIVMKLSLMCSCRLCDCALYLLQRTYTGINVYGIFICCNVLVSMLSRSPKVCKVLKLSVILK